MRLAADTLAPQATAGASRRRVPGGTACAPGRTFTTWRTSGLYGFTGTKPCRADGDHLLVNKPHVGNITTRRLSEASP